MAYTERHESCVSSIPATFYPSNVDKSSQPCPLLSSSLTSPLLISNTNDHNVTINTDTISTVFDSKEKDKVTYVLSSSLDYTQDYYTNKRIEQLHDRMDDIQISSFLKFINYHLSLKHKEKLVKDLSQDLSNGHILIDLIEIFSSKKLKREYGHTRFHSLTNIQYVLDYLKLHMQHINISPHEIVSGNRKQILALLWIIMKIFDFPSFRITTNKHLFNENTMISFGYEHNILIKWINNLLNKILNTHNKIYIKNFYFQTWINNLYFLLIIKYLCPLSTNYGTLEYYDYMKQFDELNFINQEEYIQLCLNLSNYCFNTIIIIDYTDQTEKYLFKFFSELKQNILFILKSNHIGKLTKINSYTKKLFDTILETTIIEYSPTIEEDEDYLVCIEDKQKQELINQSNEKKNLQSLINSMHTDEILEQKKTIILNDESEQVTNKTKNSEESLLSPIDTTDIIQKQSTCNRNLSENLAPMNDDNLQNQNSLRSRKLKKKKSMTSIEKLTSILVPTTTTTISNKDLFGKTIHYLNNSKIIVFKYILILVCLCFSIFIIFIHK